MMSLFSLEGVVLRPLSMLRPGPVITGVLIALVLTAPTAADRGRDQEPGQTADPFVLVSTDSTRTLERELSALGVRGYRIKAVWNSSHMHVLLEKADEPRDFRMIAALSRKTLDRELAEAAAEGYRLVPTGIVRNPYPCSTMSDQVGPEAVLLLERTPGTPDRYEYFLDQTERKANTLKNLVKKPAEQGFVLVAFSGMTTAFEATCSLHSVLVWEREVSSPETPRSDMGRERRQYQVAEGRIGEEFSEKLQEALDDGYRIASDATFFEVLEKDRVAVILERPAEPGPAPDYLVLGALDLVGLQNQLDVVGRVGYHMRRQALSGDPLVVLVERDVTEQRAYGYRLWTADEPDAVLDAWIDTLATPGDVQVVGFGATRDARYESLPATSDPFGSLFGSRPSYTIERESRPSSCTTCPEGAFSRQLAIIETSRVVSLSSAVAEVSPDTPRTRVVSLDIGKKPGDMEQAVNRVARDGYRILTLSVAPSGDRVEVTLRSDVSAAGAAEYRLLTTTRESTMQDELNELSIEGFQLPFGAFFAKPTKMSGLEVAAFMERVPGERPAHEYVVLTGKTSAALDAEIAAAESDAYVVVGRLNSGKGHIAFVRRPPMN